MRKRIRVVVVDDHPSVRRSVAWALVACGFDVLAQAGDGAEAVDVVSRLQPDLVTMDVNMPTMDGLAATREIRHRHPGVVVVGLSMHDDDAMARAMLEAGAAAFVAKGAGIDELARVVQSLVRPPGRCRGAEAPSRETDHERESIVGEPAPTGAEARADATRAGDASAAGRRLRPRKAD